MCLFPGPGGRGDFYEQGESESLSSVAPSLAFYVIKTPTQAEAQRSGNICPRSYRANTAAQPGFEWGVPDPGIPTEEHIPDSSGSCAGCKVCPTLSPHRLPFQSNSFLSSQNRGLSFQQRTGKFLHHDLSCFRIPYSFNLLVSTCSLKSPPTAWSLSPQGPQVTGTSVAIVTMTPRHQCALSPP